VRNDRTLQSIVDKVCPQYTDDDPEVPKEGGTAEAQDGDAAAQRRIRQRTGDSQVSFSLQEDADTALPLQLERPYLRTDTRMTIVHVAKYILAKTRGGEELPEDVRLQVLCHDQALRSEWSLAHVYREHWNNPLQDMVLTFKVVKKPSARPVGEAPAVAAPGGSGSRETPARGQAGTPGEAGDDALMDEDGEDEGAADDGDEDVEEDDARDRDGSVEEGGQADPGGDEMGTRTAWGVGLDEDENAEPEGDRGKESAARGDGTEDS